MKPIRLGKAAGELNVGISTLVEFLAIRKNILIDPNPNTQIEPWIYRLLQLKFRGEDILTLEDANDYLNKVGMTTIVETLRDEFKVPIDKPYSTKDLISSDEFSKLRKYFKVNYASPEQLEKYFNLDISDEDLYAAGDVKQGVHGVETYLGYKFATLFHFQQGIAKGELKRWLSEYVGSEQLKQLGNLISHNYNFPELYVKYSEHNYKIKKYPCSVLLAYFKESMKEALETFEKDTPDADFLEYKESEVTYKEVPDLNEKAHGVQSISGKYFKRFKQLNSLSIGRINFFVGPNNAGKSTVVEMLRLIKSYISQTEHDKIDLNRYLSEGGTERTFGRIINSDAKESQDHDVVLGGKIADCHFIISFYGQYNDNNVDVKTLQIQNPLFDLLIDATTNDFESKILVKNIVSGKEESKEDIRQQLLEAEDELSIIEHKLEQSNLTMNEKLALSNSRNEIENKQKELRKALRKSKTGEAQEEMFLEFEIPKRKLTIKSLDAILYEMYQVNDELIRTSTKVSNDIQAARNLFDLRYHEISSYLTKITGFTKKTETHYLEGTSIKLSAVINGNSSSKGIYRSIRSLSNGNVFENKENRINTFIRKWLDKDNGFGIARDFRVNNFENEAFTLELLQDDWRHLGDFGLGAQRLVELIFGIARIIHHLGEDDSYQPIIIVEEPEAHVHPKLQSALALLFFEVENGTYSDHKKIRFIIETHSEYLIRKTQLIGLENGLFEEGKNPFRVIYFDPEQGPYNMEYRSDGKFSNEFGKGFYDVSSDLMIQLL